MFISQFPGEKFHFAIQKKVNFILIIKYDQIISNKINALLVQTVTAKSAMHLLNVL